MSDPGDALSSEQLRDHIQSQLERITSEGAIRAGLLPEELDRRFASVQLQMDQRFAASQAAVQEAMVAADKAVQAALKSAELAVNKAEMAAEKRFDSVNEFRRTLADQTATFVTADKFDGLAALVSSLSARLDRGEGSRTGVAEHRTEQRLGTGQVVQIIAVLLTMAGLIIVAFHG